MADTIFRASFNFDYVHPMAYVALGFVSFRDLEVLRFKFPACCIVVGVIRTEIDDIGFDRQL